MPEKTLDEQTADAEQALATASNFTERHHAGKTLDRLNAAKLVALQARTDPATGVIRPTEVGTIDGRKLAES